MVGRKVCFDESARAGTKRGSRQFSVGKIDELRRMTKCRDARRGVRPASLNLRNSTDFTSERSGSQSLHLKACRQPATQLQLPMNCRREPSRMPWSIFWYDYCVTFDNEWSECCHCWHSTGALILREHDSKSRGANLSSIIIYTSLRSILCHYP